MRHIDITICIILFFLHGETKDRQKFTFPGPITGLLRPLYESCVERTFVAVLRFNQNYQIVGVHREDNRRSLDEKSASNSNCNYMHITYCITFI